MLKWILIAYFSIISHMTGQENISTNFYSLSIPNGIKALKFNNNYEEFSYMDSYKIIKDDKLQFIFYLLSNKLNSGIEKLSIDNYKDFIFDLGEIEITSIDTRSAFLKMTFSYKNDSKVFGIIYISVKNDILNRFVFVVPNNLKNYKAINEDINLIMNGVKMVKEFW